VTLDDYNAFCRSLPQTTHVVQWGGADVWKVAGKVFAIGRWDEDDADMHVTFKVSELSYDLLKDQPGCRPAPYLASRGMTWIQRTGPASMDDAALRDYIAASHRLVALGLPRRVQQELGLGEKRPRAAARARARSPGARTTTKRSTSP
jgi:predicted DNA-binding protein (MmcQ/YjbR family)